MPVMLTLRFHQVRCNEATHANAMWNSKHQTNYLDMIPARNVQEFTEDKTGQITLLIPKFKKAWMSKWLIPEKRSKHFRIHLDEQGSEIWRLIDGKKNAGEICDLLFQQKPEESNANSQFEIRVTKFMSQLYKNRFILFK
jgi:hypothetical protein